MKGKTEEKKERERERKKERKTKSLTLMSRPFSRFLKILPLSQTKYSKQLNAEAQIDSSFSSVCTSRTKRVCGQKMMRTFDITN